MRAHASKVRAKISRGDTTMFTKTTSVLAIILGVASAAPAATKQYSIPSHDVYDTRGAGLATLRLPTRV
jgi:hypothetical protein